MKRRFLAMMAIPVLMFCAARVNAQSEDRYANSHNPTGRDASDLQGRDDPADIVVPPGMELKKVGGLYLIMPKDAHMRKENSRWIMEDPEDSNARNINEIKARLEIIEKEQKEIRKNIVDLKDRQKK